MCRNVMYVIYQSCISNVNVFGLSGFQRSSSMFGKKKKRLEISAPSNFEHRVHTGFDPREQKFTGLPQQWQSLLADTANRPKPMVDPSYITPIQLAPMKVECRGQIISIFLYLTTPLMHNLFLVQNRSYFRAIWPLHTPQLPLVLKITPVLLYYIALNLH